MWKTILNLIFPVQCIGCGQEGNSLCYSCFKSIPLNNKSVKDNLIIASYYNNPLVKNSIHRFKYDFIKDLASPLGLLMVKKLEKQNIKNPLLVPVPLHSKRLRWRGFNQAELLANEISRKLNIPVFNNILIRKKYSPPQAKIQNANLRINNIKNSFCLNSNFKGNLENKNIILIDDICTSGSTLNECSKVLKTLNPKNIYKLVISRE